MSALRSAMQWGIGLAASAILAWGAAGCGVLGDGSLPGQGPGVLGVQVSATDAQQAGDNAFASPERVNLSAEGTALITGTIEAAGDVVAYDIGPVFVGDRIRLESTSTGGLNAAAAVFDAERNLICVNDDRSSRPGGNAPYVNLVSRRSTDGALLVVTSSPRQGTTGNYTVNLTVERIAELVEDRPQVVVLGFDGATGIRVGGRGPLNLPAFDAAAIDASYAGQTGAMIDAIVTYVRQDFAGLNVFIFASGDSGIPAGPLTTVYFGLYDPNLLGLADYVDVQNSNPSQSAIVYAETFSLFMPLRPSVERMAQTLANVASHEAGHLLGLNHTRDPAEIMDISATAYELTQDQTFRRSPLEPNVFSVGWQDGFGMLLENVGGDRQARRQSAAPLGPTDEVEPLPADDPLMTVPLMKCNHLH